ncbi:hypothetical protein MMC18_008479 [Xylographa bjoerkii]|nr:hypothetical protein [Xylographa bjoerkii]MCJ1395593.1 hypothetical protein [Xylographa bjoerkii]
MRSQRLQTIDDAQQDLVFYAEDKSGQYQIVNSSQNNEEDALKSWQSALDKIYYHNAYRVPPNYRPASETEKALQDSLHDMELQCKERVDLLKTLRQSRMEIKDNKDSSTSTRRASPTLTTMPTEHTLQEPTKWIGQGTVPALIYPDLSRPGPPLPQRPLVTRERSSASSITRLDQQNDSSRFPPPYSAQPLPGLSKHGSRSPSPEKRSRLLTTLRPNKDGKRPSKSRDTLGRKSEPPAASKAAGLAWDSISRSSGQRLSQALTNQNGSSNTINTSVRSSFEDKHTSKRDSATSNDGDASTPRSKSFVRPRSPPDLLSAPILPRTKSQDDRRSDTRRKTANVPMKPHSQNLEDLICLEPPLPSSPQLEMASSSHVQSRETSLPIHPKPPPEISYRHEYPAPSQASKASAQAALSRQNRHSDALPFSTSPAGGSRQRSPQRKPRPPVPASLNRRPIAKVSSPRDSRPGKNTGRTLTSSDSGDENTSSSRERKNSAKRSPQKNGAEPLLVDASLTPGSTDRDSPEGSLDSKIWEERVAYIRKNLPKGVDENAAKQIFNEIVVQGDEVHWSDVAGLEPAKTALKEAVVYPFLRPDLFMGLREPARGMLLFGPPGTGKTMLARAVATESRSTFFAISASSLTSKFLGESEKLVRALFALARALAPSIIFVDEIDSLLSSRGGSSEHESTRRIKTEFLIQWSDLQRAAAGKEQTEKEKKEGDASRVLVLAATNLPWAIDEAARRRFVRRQYIPLPEGHVRATQLKTLLSHQKHNLTAQDIAVLVELTDGFSGSDITALAKDAAMGPLRSLGEALLHMSMDEIRPIQFADFEASLINIRPSVSKQGLKEFEDWAREFGERGG